MSHQEIKNLVENSSAGHAVASRALNFGISVGLTISLASLASTLAFADSTGDLDKRTPSIYSYYRVGYATRKSTVLKTTDFGTEYITGLGLWAGKSKNVGLAVAQDQTRTHFSQVDASANTSWTDATITYRYLWFSPSFIVGDGAMTIERDGTPLVSSLCLTTGFGLDIHVPASQYVIATVGGKYLSPRKSYGNEREESSLGYRSDYNLEVAFYPSVEWMSILAGYRARLYQVRVGDEFMTETELGPNLGISLQYDM